MANGQGTIDEIIGEKAIEGVKSALHQLEILNAQFKDTTFSVNVMNAALGNTKNIKELTKAIESITSKVATLTKIQAQAAVENEKLHAAEIRTQQEKVKLDKLEADLLIKKSNAAKKVIQDVEHEEGSYNKLNNTLNELRKQYMALGTEAMKANGPELLKRIQAVDTQLKSLDAGMGKFSRNVGNYQSATYSLSQVLRELPAFTYSAQQGFLAIGNNMPILIDQFKLVRASVDSTGKAIKIFAASIFSFVNVFTILSGLFTIFYKDIMEFVSGSTKGADVIAAMSEAADEAAGSMTKLSESLELAKKGVISKEEFVRQYNESLGVLYGTTENFNEAEQITISNAQAYIDNAKAKAEANVLLKQAIDAKNASEAFSDKSWGDMLKAQLGFAGQGFKMGGVAGLLGNLFATDKAADWMRTGLKIESEEAAKAFATAWAKIKPNAIKSSNGNTNGTDSQKPEDRIKAIADAYEQELKRIEVSMMLGGYTEEQYWTAKGELASNYIRKLETINKLTNSETESKLDTQYKLIKDIKEAATEIVELRGNDIEPIDWAKHGTEQLNKLLEYIKKIKGEVTTINLGKTKDGKESYWDNYTSMGSSSMDIIGSIGTALFQKEMMEYDERDKRLKAYYDNEKRFIEQSGFSASQKQKMQQKLEAETEAKRKQNDRDRVTALRKQAVMEKAYHITQIIAETALGIMKALRTVPYPLNIAQAAAVGVAGAAQLARVIATPLPQYARGRKGGRKEWAVVGEAGQEAIVHNGRVELTPNQATVTLLPEGADVIPNHELIKNAAYVKLSKQGTVTTDKLQAALIESYERNTNELRSIKQVLIDKKFFSEHKDLSGYESYRQSKVQ